MKIKGLKSNISQITFDGNHPSSGIVFTESWERLRHIIAVHYKDQSDNIISFKFTPVGLEVYLKDFYEKI